MILRRFYGTFYIDNMSLRLIEVTSVDEVRNAELPESFRLYQSYPDPFNLGTFIEFDLPKESFFELSVYNIAGHKVGTILSRIASPGYHRAFWDGRDSLGREVSSGPYVCELKAGDLRQARRMILLK